MDWLYFDPLGKKHILHSNLAHVYELKWEKKVLQNNTYPYYMFSDSFSSF